MATLTKRVERRTSFLAFLGQELAPEEGRGAAVARIAAACTITVAVAMVFRIPLAAYMAYMVFLTSKDDSAATVTMAVGGMLAITLAVMFSLGLSQVDLGDPALRLPAMALTTFLAMFSVRTFALGPVSFLAGFVIVTVQSVVDVASPEAFTRTTLWLWVVVAVPVVITVVINLLFGPVASARAERGVRTVLTDLKSALSTGPIAGRLVQWRAILVPLIEKSRNPSAIHRLLNALLILEVYPHPIPPRERQRLSHLVGRCLCALERRSPMAGEKPSETASSPEALAATHAFAELERELTSPDTHLADHTGHKPRQLFVLDALSNPAHWQFALKTTLAIMIVYSVYTMLDWPGLRTSIVTCFFVALGSIGETVHKLLLRLSGAITGGLLAGLSIVLLLPHFTDIGQLSALTAVVALFAGWVATSSERLSYAGLQIAFAFFLGLLQTYSPATDLTVLRDRVVGIILGNIVMTLVFSTLWPESAITRLRAALSDVQRYTATLLSSPADRSANRQRTIEALTRARHYEELSRFERELLPDPISRQARVPDVNEIERRAAAAFVATETEHALPSAHLA